MHWKHLKQNYIHQSGQADSQEEKNNNNIKVASLLQFRRQKHRETKYIRLLKRSFSFFHSFFWLLYTPTHKNVNIQVYANIRHWFRLQRFLSKLWRFLMLFSCPLSVFLFCFGRMPWLQLSFEAKKKQSEIYQSPEERRFQTIAITNKNRLYLSTFNDLIFVRNMPKYVFIFGGVIAGSTCLFYLIQWFGNSSTEFLFVAFAVPPSPQQYFDG